MIVSKKILITGSAGFIGGYVVQEFLDHGWHVVGIDNYSKYGKVEKSYDSHPNYTFHEGDVKNTEMLKEVLGDCSQMLAGAAMIGGISYFHEFAYDLLAENERIVASTFDAAIDAFKRGTLDKVTILSSSMVFESCETFPTPEGEQLRCPPPISTYGFQKLACEYFARGAYEQYKLPYTIVRPFNCVGVGEQRALCDKTVCSGNVELAMSHVVPDLIQKIVKGQDPLHILGSGGQIRHYTYGGDLARGIRLCVETEAATNEDFNLSTPVSTTVLELAELIWKKIKGDTPFSYASDEPFTYDVQKRVPAVEKAKKVLGYETTTSLDEILDEVIPWVTEQVKLGNI
jgi:nucleoside-diphosphate-sugar epimerase